jgi:hypothetical protein
MMTYYAVSSGSLPLFSTKMKLSAPKPSSRETDTTAKKKRRYEPA